MTYILKPNHAKNHMQDLGNYRHGSNIIAREDSKDGHEPVRSRACDVKSNLCV